MYEYVFKKLYKHKLCYALITASRGIDNLFISLCNKEVKFYFVVLKDYVGFRGKARFSEIINNQVFKPKHSNSNFFYDDTNLSE